MSPLVQPSISADQRGMGGGGGSRGRVQRQTCREVSEPIGGGHEDLEEDRTVSESAAFVPVGW